MMLSTSSSATGSGGSRERVERVNEAVVGVRVFADDWHVVPAIGVQDAHYGGSGERSNHVQLEVHWPAALQTTVDHPNAD